MLPLTGKRILVTRARQQASGLAAQLEVFGAEPIVIPVIEIVPPESYAVMDEALRELDRFDWMVFTSANAVDVFAARCIERVFPGRIAAIGPSTAKALEALGLHVDLLPQKFIAESMADALAPHTAGKRVLLIRGEEARDVLPKALQSVGAELTVAPAYRNRAPSSSIPAMHKLFGEMTNYPDAITLTSASTVRSLLALLEESGIRLPDHVPLASIGPITSEAARAGGYKVLIEAREATIPSLVEGLVHYFQKALSTTV